MEGVFFENPMGLAYLSLAVAPLVLWHLSGKKYSRLKRFFEIRGIKGYRRRVLLASLVSIFLLSMASSVPYTVYRERVSVGEADLDLLSGKVVQIVFLVDVSKSMKYELAGEERILIAKKLLEKALDALGPNTTVVLATFSGRVRIAYRGPASKAWEKVENITAGERYTAIGDALTFALSLAKASGIPTGVVLVSDGRNNYGIDPVSAAKEYRRADTPLILVSIGEEGVLPDVAEASGGRLYSVNSFTVDALGDLSAELARKARYSALKARGEAFVEVEKKSYLPYYASTVLCLGAIVYLVLERW